MQLMMGTKMNKPPKPDVPSLQSTSRSLSGLRRIQEIVGGPDRLMSEQMLAVFLYVAERHPTPVAAGELEKELGMTQSSTNRLIHGLGKGRPNSTGEFIKGFGLVRVEPDPYYAKRMLVSLTATGVARAALLRKD